MQERTRRLICRIVFLVACVAPTICTLGWIAWRASPGYASAERAYWTEAIHSHLGLRAQIQSIARPRRSAVLLQRVELTDPDSEQRVGRIRLIELAHTDQGLVILASQPEVERGQFLRLWEILHDRLLCGGRGAAPAQLIAAELTVHARPQSLTFTGVRCHFSAEALCNKATVEFRLAGTERTAGSQIQMVRQREAAAPVTRWHLVTGEVFLPCALLADYCPPLRRLGKESRFRGSIWAERAAGGWNGEIAGRFCNVDLQSLTEPFPGKLSGCAEVMFTHASFRDGRLKDAAGSLRCGGGVVSTSLVAEVAKAFQLRIEPRRADNEEPLRAYRQLALGFQLDAKGIQLRGLCEGGQPGTLLADASGTWVGDSPAEPVPAVALARALSPQNDLQVPATEEADLLLRALPLPAASAPRTLAARPPRTSVRLRTQ